MFGRLKHDLPLSQLWRVQQLDSLVGDAEAAEVLKMLLELDVNMGKAAIRYIGLFRPAKSQLSWARTAKLLNELLPMIKAETVERDGVSYPPLRRHGYMALPKLWPRVMQAV